MAKFKIGDTVKILDGSTIPEYTCGWCDAMKADVGKTCKIEEFVDFGDRTGVRLEDMNCTWDERGLEFVEPSCKFKIGDIVIGNKDANLEYTITREGWIGRVIKIRPNKEIEVEGRNFLGEISKYWVNPSYFDLYNQNASDKLIYEEATMSKFSFKTEEGFRIDKTCNKQIPTITTTIYYASVLPWGSATCDKADYDEREGILNAIANAMYGNFDREYGKYKAAQEREYKALCKCSSCGKSFKTPEEARACEKAHVERKKAKHENYLLRKEAKKKIAEAERDGKINELVRQLTSKRGK